MADAAAEAAAEMDAFHFEFELDAAHREARAGPEYQRVRPALGALMVVQDRKHRGYVHPTAIDVAAVVLVAFVAAAQGRAGAVSYAQVWAMVVALPQSGKTGVMQALWRAVCSPEFVAQHLRGIVEVGGAVFITGVNDNDLLGQTAARLNATYSSTELDADARAMHNAGLQKLIAGWHRADQEGADRGHAWDVMRRRCLIVIDESHHGSCEGSTVDKLLEELGISGDGSARRGGSHYVVSISATPVCEVARNADFGHKLCLHLQPGRGYVGPMHILAQGRVRPAGQLSSARDVEALLGACWDAVRAGGFDRGEERGCCYAVVRVPVHGGRADLLKDRLRALGYGYKEYDAENVKDVNSITALLKRRPESMVFVLVKRRLAQGVTIDTRHVAIMYDTAASKADTVAQSFLGRACGYRSREEQRTLVYCDQEQALSYIHWAKDSFRPESAPMGRCMTRALAAEPDEGDDEEPRAAPRRRRRYQGAAPVVVGGAMTEEELGRLRVRTGHNQALVAPLLRGRWAAQHPRLLHLTLAPFAEHAPYVRVVRDDTKENAELFRQATEAAAAGAVRLPCLHREQGEHRCEVVVDARTGSDSRGAAVVMWRGAELGAAGGGRDASVIIPVGQAQDLGLWVPKQAQRELWGRRRER